MKIWMLSGSLDGWNATREFAGFAAKVERAPISAGDTLIYFCNGLILGVFEAQGAADGEFGPWEKSLPFQVKLRPIIVPQGGMLASPLHYKTSLQRHAPDSPRLFEISGREYGKIMQALSEGRKELVF